MTDAARRLIAACLLISMGLGGARSSASLAASPVLDAGKFDPSCGIEVEQQDMLVVVTWPIGNDQTRRARAVFGLDPTAPLIRSLELATTPKNEFQVVATSLEPVYQLRVGERDLKLRNGWTVFFDRMQNKPHQQHQARLGRDQVSVTSRGRRATLAFGPLEAGPFQGHLEWTFFAGDPFVLQEAVLSTSQNGVAYLYDAGLVCRGELPNRFVWKDTDGKVDSVASSRLLDLRTLAVRGRAVAAEFAGGAVAVIPPPHRYFYPLDYSTNLKNAWIGRQAQDSPPGFGIRHDPRGDNRFVPWFNAPPGSQQRLGLFWQLDTGSAQNTLADVAKLTRGDRLKQLPGHVTFSSHYHVEHTQALLDAQQLPKSDDDLTTKTSSGMEYRVPTSLREPGFARVFRDIGLDIVHLAEFHFGHTPKLPTNQRLLNLDLLHAECARLSDERLLLLPGEEPNVHVGGHWISLFPKPVFWVLNRPVGKPFVMDDPLYGKVYHVGSEADVYRLLQAEQGLAWTAHPRIKGSTGFPDNYRQSVLFQSNRFLGAAWKAMPADLSQPRLGSRVLDLLDDMSNWGVPKYVLGEVDVFQIEPDHELYGHMNVNYLRLDQAPRYAESWQPILNALRAGRFFVTTGEVLIADFSVDGKQSGEAATISTEMAEVRLDLQWTFPLDYAEIITGNGTQIERHRVDLSHTNAFGQETFKLPAKVGGQRWLRVEVWDVATNGAFTQPVWLASP